MKAPWLLLVKWTTILLLLESAPPTAGQSIPRPEDSQRLSFPELDRAASDVIQRLKSIYPNGKVAVLGGAAIEKYLPGHRSTRDIDIYQTIGSSLDIKKELLKDPRFYTRQTMTDNIDVTRKEYLFYRNANGKNIEIDLPGKQILTFDPASAKVLRDIPAGTVPYISVDELVISKIESSRRRPEAAKKALDISDAKALLEKYPETTFTTENHRQVVETFLSEHNRPSQQKPPCKGDSDCPPGQSPPDSGEQGPKDASKPSGPGNGKDGDDKEKTTEQENGDGDSEQAPETQEDERCKSGTFKGSIRDRERDRQRGKRPGTTWRQRARCKTMP
ncbi:hypothetical protein HIM_11861 [Hirsutella minnesotensis 3608]|uniref:Nucleotidyl transferase AbiEii/AbiGii toxin family protein n=1 Tax=Hirsutella minnesotensis 3608 TaxID=1043627 RepID=A0A0F7ZWC9_9HYPO|nr:hypothetical protein HIM_11861 [Hirsutella minnesotensis 3608]